MERALLPVQAYMAAAETLAKLHSVAPEDVGLGDYGPRAGYCRRQVGLVWTSNAYCSPCSAEVLEPPRRYESPLCSAPTTAHMQQAGSDHTAPTDS